MAKTKGENLFDKRMEEVRGRLRPGVAGSGTSPIDKLREAAKRRMNLPKLPKV